MTEPIKMNAAEIELIKTLRKPIDAAQVVLNASLAGIAAARGLTGQFGIDDKAWEIKPIEEKPSV